MNAVIDLARRRAATAYAQGDLDTLLTVALDALSDLDKAYDRLPTAGVGA